MTTPQGCESLAGFHCSSPNFCDKRPIRHYDVELSSLGRPGAQAAQLKRNSGSCTESFPVSSKKE